MPTNQRRRIADQSARRYTATVSLGYSYIPARTHITRGSTNSVDEAQFLLHACTCTHWAYAY